MEIEAFENLIQTRLTTLAGLHNVNILYACESGSRAWGFASPDSDYDVRFVYAHPVSWYLSLLEDKDVINLPIETTPQGILDLGGWDVRKTLRLVVKSNPVIWEWLQSPMCYQADPLFDVCRIREVIDPFYSPITACQHYLSICRNTLEKELTGQTVKIKKYFYMLRPLLAASWIERFRSIPPMEFAPLLTLLEDKPDSKEQVDNLVQLKLNTDEQIPIDRITLLDDLILSELSRLQAAAQQLPAGKGDMSALNQLLLSFIGNPEAH